jgi:hypothetical protein
MENTTLPRTSHYTDPETQVFIADSVTVYVSDCTFITNAIAHEFNAHLEFTSPYEDGSPDLTACCMKVLDECMVAGRPRAEWLKWESQTGLYLFCALVAIKMRAWLEQTQPGILSTMAWEAFELGRGALREKILDEVAKDEGEGVGRRCDVIQENQQSGETGMPGFAEGYVLGVTEENAVMLHQWLRSQEMDRVEEVGEFGNSAVVQRYADHLTQEAMAEGYSQDQGMLPMEKQPEMSTQVPSPAITPVEDGTC